MKPIITIAFLIFVALMPGSTYAFQNASGSSAKLVSTYGNKLPDRREQILKDFLLQYDSPLAANAGDFVTSADKYSLDWRLVASIAGLESTFGQHIPYNSHNAWGWGVYGDNVIRFNSWSEGIEVISKGLRERYLKDNPETDPYLIGLTYAASPTWAQRVSYFMARIEDFEKAQSAERLPLSI
ncbi:MAG: hypothetical protein A2186_00160 [Candidatus Levybacteria bacterium RIFOXYA1_FULL_41_10]|nr:MAG: hypothetical protein UT44_C0022G0003 [Candidatus Levybacteria bacterium GW2011_GWA1_39_32]KKR50115.1 MAG: hypothetical protein UT87_C0020G0003 [Candidatus Levybacteria bacterium GW2011_GWC1_40_19]KKR94963.1 MAG: hypothetical protein UU45_C0005G0021 [Candidatus Levybacteria bacterium GW2011_GWA2_41_15]OGH21117.1 MAG: hypothetical protein A2695_00105 [Candidatus Levybacteria bacterium RIFCSPHIGHO2_01_FULL_40_83]OGH25573.1 MAG: hypothetical protein A3D82_03860 [Candidatus Levybacteria bact